MGPDGVGNIVLRSSAQSLSIPLTVIINRSLKVVKFPSYWKIANIIPIDKKRT